MKPERLIGLILTLLMLLLVMAAAFVFLFQGRRTLLTRNAALNTSLDVMGVQATAVANAQATAQRQLATAEANAVLLEGQLVTSQQELDDLMVAATAVAESNAQLEQERQALLERPPQVTIISPTENQLLPVDEPISIVAAATDLVGVTVITVTVNDEMLDSINVAALPLVTINETWTPPRSGTVTLGVAAGNGRASTLITRTLSITSPTSQESTIALDTTGALRADIEANVSALRALGPLAAPETVLLTGSELAARAAPAIDMATAEAQAALLRSLDFVDADFSADDYVETIASPPAITSYYDDDTNMMLVAGDLQTLTPAQQLAYAASFVQLLQDQHFDRDRLRDPLLSADTRLALAAFAAGEEALVQNLYLRADFFSEAEREAILDGLGETAAATDTPLLPAQDELAAMAGLPFVQTLYDEGGFGAIDAAWQTPPRSTEQLLHLDRYRAGELPVDVSLPLLDGVLGADAWTAVTEGVLGEWQLRRYLAQQLSAEQVETAATGWGGDRYVIYENEAGDQLMALQIVWDTLDDSNEFAALYAAYPTRLYGTESDIQPDQGECWQGDMTICLYQREQTTTIIRAPDAATATAVANVLLAP